MLATARLRSPPRISIATLPMQRTTATPRSWAPRAARPFRDGSAGPTTVPRDEETIIMGTTWKPIVVALAMAALAPAAAHAACGDLNNDGSRTLADVIILSQCLANGGTCPAVSPGPLCGTGSLAACGDVFGDGDTSFPVAMQADLSVLLASQAGLSTLYDICDGPSPAKVIACGGGTVTLPSQTITTGQTWPKTCKVVLGGTILVSNPASGPTTVLRIEPGSIVQGSSTATDPATLIFL